MSPAGAWSRLRLRQSPHARELLSDTTFTVGHLIQPIFVVEGLDAPEAVDGLGENRRFDLQSALDRVARDVDAGVRHVLLFAVPAARQAAPARFDHLQRTVEAIKARAGDGVHLWTDICLCSWTDDGHCALFDERGGIDLDASLRALAVMATAVAAAGADGISPSDMMDGRTAAIRVALDQAGHHAVPIMSYSTKFASAFYGPFREAADSAPAFGDRRGYQMDPANRREARREATLDAAEGADVLMVKPALPYLDVLADLRRTFDRPLAAYHVSGEWAMLRAAAERGWIDGDRVLMESLVAIRRAGADWIITYGAREAALRLAAVWTE